MRHVTGDRPDLPGGRPRAAGHAARPEEAAALATRAWSALPEVAAATAVSPRLRTSRRLRAVPDRGAAAPLLLVHEYRRLALRDRDLPRALLPAAWPGEEARALAAAL
jgi:phenylacetic acid degradation operon negative regulatory protein